jgi:hypothetical protein
VAAGATPEEVSVSFASEPGREDGNLPPVNVVIPDDARELDRDVLAYHREMRSRRRRDRLTRVFRPLRVARMGGQAAIIPLIAICLAVSLVGGALLSVVTMSPAAAPTLSAPASPARVSGRPLPAGNVRLYGTETSVQKLTSAAIALLPAGCDCGPQLKRLADQARSAQLKLYFAASGLEATQLTDLANQYGDGRAFPVEDDNQVLTDAYRPLGLTVLLVDSHANATVKRALPAGFDLTSELTALAHEAAQEALIAPAN